VEAAGIEPLAESSGKRPNSRKSGAESGAVCERDEGGARNAALDADLIAVIQIWPHLPKAIRAGILAIARATQSGESTPPG